MKDKHSKDAQDSIKKGFVKDISYLEEDIDTEDLHTSKADAKGFSDWIRKLSKTPAIISVIGTYGIGKTFMLNLAKKELGRNRKNTVYFFEFEAWRYAERSTLWRAFVSELDDHVLGTKFEHAHRARFRIWTGKIKRYFRKLFTVGERRIYYLIVWIGLLACAIAHLSNQSVIAVATLLVALFALIFSVIHLYLQDPLRQQEGSELILKEAFEILAKLGYKEIYVVLEDVDRSGDNGLLFLETLSFFIRKKLSQDITDKLSVKFIVPVSDMSYSKPRQRASFSKAGNYTCLFTISSLNAKRFVDRVFKKRFVTDEIKGYTKKIFQDIIFTQGRGLNLRTWKAIVRGAQAQYIYLKETKKFSPHPSICMLVEAMKYCHAAEGTTLFNDCLAEGIIPMGREYKHIVELLVRIHEGLPIGAKVDYDNIVRISSNPKLTSKSIGTGKFGKANQPQELHLSRAYFDVRSSVMVYMNDLMSHSTVSPVSISTSKSP